jgi:hypothetical protein
MDVADSALAGMVGAYGERPAALAWYLSTMILRRAGRPFRYFEPAWPSHVAGMVAASEEALRR